MSDLGNMRLNDVYRGMSSASKTINQETNLDSLDRESMAMASNPTYKDPNTDVEKYVTTTDKTKIMYGLAGFVGFILLMGMLK